MGRDTLSFCHPLPTEILLYIFSFLPAKELIKCRHICVRWKDIIDGLCQSDSLWYKYCRDDNLDVYKIARKNRPGLSWYNIYRSLSLWPRLNHAKVVRDEFASAISIPDEINSIEVLQDGTVGVHTKTAIVFFDTATFERSTRNSLTGDYSRYAENNDVVILCDFHFHLYIVRKVFNLSDPVTHASFDNVKIFMLLDHKIYYITLKDEIYQCKFDDDDLHGEYLQTCPDGVLSLGYKNEMLHILTYERNIYALNGHNLIFECTLGSNTNFFQILQRYNLLERLEWGMYFKWMFILRQTPEVPLQDVLTVKIYGHVYFAGTTWGVLRIYYAPYFRGEYDLFSAEPMRQFNFMEREDCPVLSRCPILAIEILEDINGHTVLVAMPKKVAVLKFKHNFVMIHSTALLPFIEVREIKELNNDRFVSNILQD